ncbi:unnamed protein product, partial [Scytosiphon promiscuus]
RTSASPAEVRSRFITNLVSLCNRPSVTIVGEVTTTGSQICTSWISPRLDPPLSHTLNTAASVAFVQGLHVKEIKAYVAQITRESTERLLIHNHVLRIPQALFICGGSRCAASPSFTAKVPVIVQWVA